MAMAEIHLSVAVVTSEADSKEKSQRLSHKCVNRKKHNSIERIILHYSVSQKTSKKSYNEKPLFQLFKFLIIKYLFPNIIFFLIYLSLVLNHIFFMKSYCFCGELCSCHNMGVYIYTFFREMLQTYGVTVTWGYLTNEYLTNGYLQKKTLKFIYFSLQFGVIFGYYVVYFEGKHEKILGEVRMMSTLSLLVIIRIYALIIILFMNSFYLKNFKRLGIIIIIDMYYYMHVFFLKSALTFYVLNVFYENFPEDLALNLFKLFLLLYYSIYQVILKAFTFHLYNNILIEKKISKKIIIGITRLMAIDTLLIKVMNILTINLNGIFSWISYFNYIYSLFSMYSGMSFIDLVKRFIFHKKPSIESLKFKRLRSGCFFEANLLIFLRVIMFVFLPYYIFFTKKFELFLACSLKISSDLNEMNWVNIVLVILTHALAVGIILIYMIKKKIALINLKLENHSNLIRLYSFIVLFTYIDYSIQFYDNLKNYRNLKNGLFD